MKNLCGLVDLIHTRNWNEEWILQRYFSEGVCLQS